MASVGLETLEAPLLRVPFESLKRAAKDRKALIDEISECVAALKHPLCLPSSASAVPGAAAGIGPATTRGNTPYGTPPLSLSLTPGGTAAPTPAGTPLPPDPMAPGATPSEAGAGAGAAAGGAGGGAEDTEMADASEVNISLAPGSGADEAQAGGSLNCREASIERLRLLLSQLQGVKRKLADVGRSEQGDSQRCKARLEHLSSTGPIPKNDPRLIPWTRQRLDIILVDHLLRLGHHETANRLAAAAGIQLLTDANIFEGARRVVNALLNDHSCEPALAWCADNRARLRKVKSQLEFKLHVQQFIELVRREDRLAAIAYARANLAPWASSHMTELQRAVATLAFTARTRVEVYKSLFDDAQWQTLADMFMHDLYKLHALTPEPLLHVYLQAGLSALRTPNSGEPGGSREDPLSLPAFQVRISGLSGGQFMA